jgi:hypothetical protein
MQNRNYANSFANTNILSDEEKQSYRAFAQKVRDMDPQELFLLHSNSRDRLTTEQQDIVAWELRRRELDIYEKKHIDPNKEFTVEKMHKNVEYAKDVPDLKSKMELERSAMAGMDDKLLQRSKEIIESNPIVISSSELHNRDGGGVNMLSNKYIVEDSNGKRITVDNRKIQEHYRKMYVKAMSDATGFDYTKYDTSSDEEDSKMDYFNPVNVGSYDPNEQELNNIDTHERESDMGDDTYFNPYNSFSSASNINLNDYEDDDE